MSVTFNTPELFEDISYTKINLSDIMLDPILSNLVNAANPVAMLRSSSEKNAENPALANVQQIISPLFLREQKNDGKYLLLSGVYTYFNLLQMHQRNMVDLSKIHAFIIRRHLTQIERKMIVLHGLTESLVTRAFVSDTSKFGPILNAWFTKDDDKDTIYKSAEWVRLYPNLDSKEKVAEYLSVSTQRL